MRHFYEKNIVEIREEYTNFLITVITPLLFEGIQSMYKYAKEKFEELEKQRKRAKIENPGVLKIFQTLLKEVPMLNNTQIEKETARIREGCKCSEWFDDLIKAVIKSNIVLLTYKGEGKSLLVEQRHHEQVQAKDFIHKCYIEIARSIYNNPELFRDDYPSLKIKKNQRETCEVIKLSIKQAIRKMLPIKLILNEYLSIDYNEEQPLNHEDIRNKVNNDLFYKTDNEDDKQNGFEELSQKDNPSDKQPDDREEDNIDKYEEPNSVAEELFNLKKSDNIINEDDELLRIKKDLYTGQLANPFNQTVDPERKIPQAHRDFINQVHDDYNASKKKDIQNFFGQYK